MNKRNGVKQFTVTPRGGGVMYYSRNYKSIMKTFHFGIIISPISIIFNLTGKINCRALIGFEGGKTKRRKLDQHVRT